MAEAREEHQCQEGARTLGGGGKKKQVTLQRILCEGEDDHEACKDPFSTENKVFKEGSAENKVFEEGEDGLWVVEVRRVAAAFQLAHAHAVGQVALERVPG